MKILVQRFFRFFVPPILLLLIAQGTVNGATMQFLNFSDSSSLTLNGTATVVSTADGKILRLTPADYSKSGSVFSKVTVSATTFSTFFSFRITGKGGAIFDCNTETGADGLVFVVQSVSSNLGGIGESLGYGGISPSIGVEFDTWCNEAKSDPNSNHVAIDLNGNVVHDNSTAVVTITPDFDDGKIWYAWIDYNGTILELRVSQTTTRPATPTLQQTVNLPQILGTSQAFIGFTSGTGDAYGNHDILTWEYRDSYNPISTCVTNNTARIGGISTNAMVGTDAANYMIAGIFVNNGSKKVLVRASSVDGVLDPKVTIQSFPDGTVLYSNSSWGSDSSAAQVQQLGYAPAKTTDAAMIVTLPQGLFTFTVSPEGVAGKGIIEVYEVDSLTQ